MKRILLLVILISVCVDVYSQSAIINEKSLIKKYRHYIGKQVYSFLLDDSIRKFVRVTTVDEPRGLFSHMDIIINDSLCAEIHCKRLVFQKQFNEQSHWDKELLYKEVVRRIIFYKHNFSRDVIVDIK